MGRQGGEMYNREEYIKKISSELGRLQSELDILNSVNLYDIDIISEDFFAGLLNLIYGYQLQNANHEKKDAKAIDLFDKENKITVQVTYENDSGKIQETINKYIECKLYADYDRLVFFLLRKKKQYKKEFDTKELFHFDKQHDVIDITDLSQAIRALDTETLRKVDKYCASEISGYVQCNKKRNRILCIIGITLILMLILIFIIFIRLQYTPMAKVYASNIYPYTYAGTYSSCEEFPTLYTEEIETCKAFAIMSSIRNMGEQVSSIEQQYCEILSIDPIEEADVWLDADIVDNTFYLFAFNNGWGNADAPVIKSMALTGENLTIEINEVFQSIDHVENTEIKAADAVFMGKYAINVEVLEHYFEEFDLEFLNLYIYTEGSGYDTDFFAYLSKDENGFYLGYGGAGEPGYRISLFAVLDVDQNPSAVYFTGEDATPVVEDILQVETVLAPTKSCVVKCRNVFSVNGKPQQTNVYTAKVTVPAFADGAIGCSGALTQELARMQNQDEMSIDRVLQNYLYQPESIKDFSIDDY